MRYLQVLKLQVRSLFSRKRVEQELDEELAYHLTRQTEELMASGMDAESARWEAMRSVRDVELRKEQCRDTRGLGWLDDLGADLRYAVRSWLRAPAFALTSMLTLAVGIGATTAIFSLLDALLLRPLPVSNPQRLVRIGSLENNGINFAVPGPALNTLRHEPLLAGVCGIQTPLSTVSLNAETFPVGAHALTGDCYSTLGVRPALGRLFTPADDAPNGPRVADISYEFWQSHFAGQTSVLGKTIRIEGVPFSIIGVTEARFHGLLLGFPPAVSFPISQMDSGGKPGTTLFYWAAVLARAKPDVSADRLRAKLKTEWRRLLDNSLPADRFKGAQRAELIAMPPLVTDGSNGLDYRLRDRFRQPLAGLLVISALVLLIACMNLANLLIARGLDRRREIAVRLALGAKRGRIVRQLISESALLMLAGFGGALIVGSLAAKLLLASLSSAYVGLSIDVGLNARVLAFTAGCSVVASLLFGILPAWQTSDIDSATNLKAASRSVTGTRPHARRILISGQVALTMILVMGASLFIESLRDLRRQPLGFATHGILDAQLLPLPGSSFEGPAALAYFAGFLEQARNLPGVESASLSSFSPLFSQPYKEDISRLDVADGPVVQAAGEFASDGFLGTMRIPLVAGSDFSLHSGTDSQKTAIVSETLAKRLFGRQSAVGRHIRFGTEKETRDLEIIGVAADARLEDAHGKDLSFLYFNLWQLADRAAWGNLQLRFTGAARPVISALQTELKKDGRQYTVNVRGLEEQHELSLIQERLLASLGTAFGVLALVLATIGLFGLLSFFVTARKAEIGLRIALGAQPPAICWMVIREAYILVGMGVLIGLPICFASGPALSALAFGEATVAFEPVAFTCILLFLVASAATVAPVVRASTTDPVIALRNE